MPPSLGRTKLSQSSPEDYIDIGFNTNRAAAEFPVASVKMSRLLAEKATVHLKRLAGISA